MGQLRRAVAALKPFLVHPQLRPPAGHHLAVQACRRETGVDRQAGRQRETQGNQKKRTTKRIEERLYIFFLY